MDPLPSALFRREMGWPLHTRPFDYSRVLKSLYAKPEDNISVTLSLSRRGTGSSREEDYIFVGDDEMDPVYNMEYCNGSNENVVAVGYESGLVTLIDTAADVKKSRVRAGHGCHDSAIFSLSWSPLKPNQLATGSADQTISVWDCASDFRLLRQFRGHTRTVKKVAFHPSQPDTVASASRDGAIRIWDLRSHNELSENYITYAHSQLPNKRLKITIDTEVPVTDLLFQDDNTLISCGSHDGFIKFWDLRKTYKRLKKKEPVRTISFPLKDRACVGFSSMCLDKMNNLYAASASKEIFKFNLSSDAEEPSCVFENNEKMEFDTKMSLSSCGRYLGSGSKSTFAHIWDTWNTSVLPFMYLETEASVVTFSPQDPLKVVTGGDDGRVVIWNADVERLHKRKNILADKYKPPMSSTTRAMYLQMNDEIPMHPRYKKSKPSSEGTSSAFDLSTLLADLPNAVIDGNYSNTRLVTKLSFTPKRRPSILTMIQSSPKSSTSNSGKRSSPASSKSIITPKPKRRKSAQRNSPSSIQPKIVAFLQPFSQTVL